MQYPHIIEKTVACLETGKTEVTCLTSYYKSVPLLFQYLCTCIKIKHLKFIFLIVLFLAINTGTNI